MIALNGESYRLMLFFLPSGHVLKMSGIQAGAPLLSSLLLFWNLDKSSYETVIKYFTIFLCTCSFRSSCSAPDELSSRELENLLKSSKGIDTSVRVFDEIFVMRDAVMQVLHS